MEFRCHVVSVTDKATKEAAEKTIRKFKLCLHAWGELGHAKLQELAIVASSSIPKCIPCLFALTIFGSVYSMLCGFAYLPYALGVP